MSDSNKVKILDDLIVASHLWQDMDNTIYKLGAGDLSCSPFYAIYNNYESLAYEAVFGDDPWHEISRSNFALALCNIAIDGKIIIYYGTKIHEVTNGKELYEATGYRDFKIIENDN